MYKVSSVTRKLVFTPKRVQTDDTWHFARENQRGRWWKQINDRRILDERNLGETRNKEERKEQEREREGKCKKKKEKKKEEASTRRGKTRALVGRLRI